MTWGRLANDTLTTFTANQKILLATVTLSNPGISETVRRTRGILVVISDQGSVNEVQNGALGMIVVSDLAIAAGVASIPGPVTDQSDDGWFVWQPVFHVSGYVNAGSASLSIPRTYDFDSKAMRKVEEGFTVAVVYESVTNGQQVGVAFSMLQSRS